MSQTEPLPTKILKEEHVYGRNTQLLLCLANFSSLLFNISRTTLFYLVPTQSHYWDLQFFPMPCITRCLFQSWWNTKWFLVLLKLQNSWSTSWCVFFLSWGVSTHSILIHFQHTSRGCLRTSLELMVNSQEMTWILEALKHLTIVLFS